MALAARDERKRGPARASTTNTVAECAIGARLPCLPVSSTPEARDGDGIDGLLGMSFLSRFNINIDGKTVRISPRTAR